MRIDRIVAVSGIVIVGLLVLSTSTVAMEPGADLSELLHPTGVVRDAGTAGEFTTNALVCTNDAECDDGAFCNGPEVCDMASQCQPGTPPCLSFEGFPIPCDEFGQVCNLPPNNCTVWQGGAQMGSNFFPLVNACGGDPTTQAPDGVWNLDDIQWSKHTTDTIDFYTIPISGREGFGDVVGDAITIDTAIWTVEDISGDCGPLTTVPGTSCPSLFAGTVATPGTPSTMVQCTTAGPQVPNNSGDFNRCEIDYFIAYRTPNPVSGWGIAGEQQIVGGPAARDDFGIDQFWLEDCPPTGVFGVTWYGDDVNFPADFAGSEVCHKPGFRCCSNSGSCSILTEGSPCDIPGPIGTIATGIEACGGDPEGDGIDPACERDNCPDVFNPNQEDCDGDGEGDACEADEADQDADGDGVCNGVDNCQNTPNGPNDSENQVDSDGDGKGDICDICPLDPLDDPDLDGVCDDVDLCPGFPDQDDADGDGVPDGCDVCPGGDDNTAGALDDDDGDGVLNCNDLCKGVDDAVFGPECEGAIPAASKWGLIVLALVLLVIGKLYFGRRRPMVI